jgi:hypothetical protein
MKCRGLRAVLTAFAGVLDIAGAPVGRDQMILLAAALDSHATSKISDLVKNLAAPARTASTGHPRLGEVARLVSALKNVLNKTAASAVLIGAIGKLLADCIRANGRRATARSGRTRRCGVRDDLVAQKLKAALGDDEKFAAIKNDLRTNMAMGKPEIAALARHRQTTAAAGARNTAALKKL